MSAHSTMRIPPDCPLKTQPWRWLLKAVLAGSAPSCLVSFYFGLHEPKALGLSALIGTLFAVLIWGAYECAREWLEEHPHTYSPFRAALLFFGKWSLVYATAVAVAIALEWILFGVNGLQDRQSAFFTVFIGLVISSPIVALRAISRMIASTRSLEQAKAQASFLALKAQLSPHTLFNALNAIAALIPVDPRAAELAVERLSTLLRRILTALEQDQWSLGEEFGLLRDLLELQRTRFGERLSYELHLPESEQELLLPPLLLLPLVENSLKHGFQSKIGPCHLTVRAVDGVVRIQDDGAGRDVHAPEGVGIRTVRERLRPTGGELAWPNVESGCLVEVRLCH